jgi:hypothetical protein
MLRLRRDDFEDPHELARFAATAHMSLGEFRQQFGYLVDTEPPPLEFPMAPEGVPAEPTAGPAAVQK